MQDFLNVIPENLTLGIVILVMTLLAFFKGRKILYVLLISFFPAVMLYQAFTKWQPVTSILPDGFFSDTFNYRLGLFAIIYIFIFFIIQRVVGYEISRKGIHKILDSVLLSLGLVAESCILIFQILSLPDFYHLSSPVVLFLASASGTVILLIIALFSLLYSSRA
jgi:hypothetical protein